MNPMVPDHGNNLVDWYEAINSMFGKVIQVDVGAFDADIGTMPPLVIPDPPTDLSNCFTFKEIKTDLCCSYNHAHIKLIELIEEYIDSAMTSPRDTSKATIVWRVKPEIQDYMNFKENRKEWYGYARIKVLDKHSQLERYL